MLLQIWFLSYQYCIESGNSATCRIIKEFYSISILFTVANRRVDKVISHKRRFSDHFGQLWFRNYYLAIASGLNGNLGRLFGKEISEENKKSLDAPAKDRSISSSWLYLF